MEAGHKAIRDAMGTQEGDQARLAAVRSAAFAARSAAWDRLAAVMPLSENSNYWRACRMAAASDLESSRFYQHGAKEAGR